MSSSQFVLWKESTSMLWAQTNWYPVEFEFENNQTKQYFHYRFPASCGVPIKDIGPTLTRTWVDQNRLVTSKPSIWPIWRRCFSVRRPGPRLAGCPTWLANQRRWAPHGSPTPSRSWCSWTGALDSAQQLLRRARNALSAWYRYRAPTCDTGSRLMQAHRSHPPWRDWHSGTGTYRHSEKQGTIQELWCVNVFILLNGRRRRERTIITR